MMLWACRLVRWDMRAREGAVQDSPVLTYQEGKDYASKTNFNCMATSGHLSADGTLGSANASRYECVLKGQAAKPFSQVWPSTGLTRAAGRRLRDELWHAGDGYVVVGSQDGQIRLYNGKQFTRANTAVPGLGAPITSVDVTYDGKWILATTKSYLMVVKSIYKVPWLPSSLLCTFSAQCAAH